MILKNPAVGNKDIDPEILPLVKELNKMGLITIASCAGHTNHHTLANISFKHKDVTILIDKGIVSLNWKRK